jgi:hypothetical protein
MPVRNVSPLALSSVKEEVGGVKGDNAAVTITTTSVQATTDVVNVAGGVDCTVNLDFEITKHEIRYRDRNTADRQSQHETRTVRQHEYGHAGARNALASKALLTKLCSDVGVKWTFHVKTTGNKEADEEKLDETATTFEDAVLNYINSIIGYLDEKAVHETQRNAGMSGRPTDADLALVLAAISYTDPTTGTAKSPSNSVMTQAVSASKTGETTGETHARNTPTPDHVKPAP